MPLRYIGVDGPRTPVERAAFKIERAAMSGPRGPSEGRTAVRYVYTSEAKRFLSAPNKNLPRPSGGASLYVTPTHVMCFRGTPTISEVVELVKSCIPGNQLQVCATC